MANGIQQQTDQASEDTLMLDKDSIEFKLIVAYSMRNDHSHSHHQSSGEGEAKFDSPEDHSKEEKRKKKKKNKLLKLISCFQPEKDDAIQEEEHRPQPAVFSDEQYLEGVANELTKITDSVHFLPGEIESDSDDIVEQIVELLREYGDRLNEEIEKDDHLKQKLQAALSYGFFTKLTKAFLRRLSPEELPPAQSQQTTQIALTCEVTRRLNALDCHPMNRVLGFGAKYLQDYFTPWVNSQGGYEEVFSSNNDEEEEEIH
ncbi:uncharacterized protein LOC143514090 [Brachyhypopomus gauderio]|uniref:uncharacterized protein LOC143514090 n=1 Tax=Brachyhypopomus gauderio TaxID=698409 RepID=UPI0040435196